MINGQAVLACLFAFAVSLAAGKFLLPVLHRLKFGQQIREEGPKEHQKKAGTPTMGGVLFLAGITVAVLVFSFGHPDLLPVLFVTLGFGAVGFTDDYLKIRHHHNEGLTPKQKLLLQCVICALFALWLVLGVPEANVIKLPFTETVWEMPLWLYIPFVFAVMLGTDNGTNFIDGLDGLGASVTAVVAAFFWIAAEYLGSSQAVFCGAVLGGLLGFLCYNLYPAKVFMGDTGSLALGGFVSGVALTLGMPLFILIAGLLYAVEVLSVILQVAYFKKTGGKRLFRMAPIHHHFELGGWSETKVVGIFTAVTVLLCAVALSALR